LRKPLDCLHVVRSVRKRSALHKYPLGQLGESVQQRSHSILRQQFQSKHGAERKVHHAVFRFVQKLVYVLEIKLSGEQLHSTRTTRKGSSCLVQNQAAYIVQVLSRLPTERVPRPLSRMCRGSECMELYTHFRIRLHGVMLN